MATKKTRLPKKPKPIDIEATFHWSTREQAVAHLCACLAQGECTQQFLLSKMVPRLPKQTLHDWRKNDPDIDTRMDDAFELGCDRMAMDMIAIADDAHVDRASIKRDRVRINTRERILSAWNTRYRAKTLIGNDPENPMSPVQMVILPVEPGPIPADPKVSSNQDDE
jgi:hypothetical protein